MLERAVRRGKRASTGQALRGLGSEGFVRRFATPAITLIFSAESTGGGRSPKFRPTEREDDYRDDSTAQGGPSVLPASLSMTEICEVSMLSGAVRRGKRASLRSRSIPAPIPNPEVIPLDCDTHHSRPSQPSRSFPHARPTLLLRLHHGEPDRHLVHWSKRQSSQTRVPAQIPSL